MGSILPYVARVLAGGSVIVVLLAITIPVLAKDHPSWSSSRVARSVRFQTIESGLFGPCNTAVLVIAKSQKDWDRKMEDLLTGNQLYLAPGPPAPDVDWEHEVVILASLGECPTTGFGIEIQDVKQFGSTAILEIEVQVPASDLRHQTFTSPFHLLRVDREGLQEIRAQYHSIASGARKRDSDPEVEGILRTLSPLGAPQSLTESDEPRAESVSWGELKARFH